MSHLYKFKRMKLSIMIYIYFVLSVQSQAVINLGPFSSSFPDPLSKSQENRATSVDRKTVPKVTAMVAKTQIVKNFVVDYENSLSTINPTLSVFQIEVKRFLNDCIDYIIAKNSISGNIPGLSKLANKLRLIALFQTNKIRTLKEELETIFKTDNYMTEGERKILVLDIIDRALKITI